MEDAYERIMRQADWSEADQKQVWQEWVWGCDCNAPPLEECCDMNRMHGFGILCCIGECMSPKSAYQMSVAEIIPELPSVHLHGQKPICEFSLRELVDQIECMQLSWGLIVGASLDDDDDEQGRTEQLLRAIMARVGFIATHAFETSKAENGYEGFVLDDPQHTSVLPQQQGRMSIISRKSLRQLICVLLGLARVHDIVKRSTLVPRQSKEKQITHVLDALKPHHIEASMDFFNGLQQMMMLAPGMRLVYRTNFSGMYNDVSQVIYLHFPKFARQPQRPLSQIGTSTMHLLPLLRELLPDIPIVYDDDSQIRGLTHDQQSENDTTGTIGWAFLISCGAVFLVEAATGAIFRSYDGLAELVCYLLERMGRELIVIDEDDDDGARRKRRRKIKKEGIDGTCITEHGHVVVEDDTP